MPDPFEKLDAELLTESDQHGQAGRNLFFLCDEIGPRLTGSHGYRLAAEFMLDRFTDCGLDHAHLEPFPFTAWHRGQVEELALLTPLNRTIPCYALPYGASTGPDGIEAEVVDVGAGTVEEIQSLSEQICGKIVLTNGAGGHRKSICKRCVEAGAVGFLLHSRMEGMLLQTGSVSDGCEGPIPAIGIALESAELIRRLAEKGPVKVRLRIDCVCEPSETWNVVGELPGHERPDQIVIIGGHLDSHDIGPCAFDNGAGAVVVMEAARLLSNHRESLKRTIRFIGFAGEELGLLGSHYHAKAHAGEMDRVRFMLNCDMPGLGEPRGLGFHHYPAGEPYMKRLSQQTGTEFIYQERKHCHSDHYPFVLHSVPTAGIAGTGGRQHFIHTAADTPDKISAIDLQGASLFAARMLLRAANDEEWPDARRAPW